SDQGRARSVHRGAHRRARAPARRPPALGAAAGEMAFVFDATGRIDAAAIARATAAALADEGVEITRQPFATGLARPSLEIAGQVAAGRLNAADVRRKP